LVLLKTKGGQLSWEMEVDQEPCSIQNLKSNLGWDLKFQQSVMGSEWKAGEVGGSNKGGSERGNAPQKLRTIGLGDH